MCWSARIASVWRVVEVLENDYRKNAMACMSWTNKWIADASIPNREFLFLIDKH